MPHSNDEAKPIARLIGKDGKSVVGLLYVWEKSELAIMWLDISQPAAFVDPEIDPEMLAEGRETTPKELYTLLNKLQILAK